MLEQYHIFEYHSLCPNLANEKADAHMDHVVHQIHYQVIGHCVLSWMKTCQSSSNGVKEGLAHATIIWGFIWNWEKFFFWNVQQVLAFSSILVRKTEAKTTYMCEVANYYNKWQHSKIRMPKTAKYRYLNIIDSLSYAYYTILNMKTSSWSWTYFGGRLNTDDLQRHPLNHNRTPFGVPPFRLFLQQTAIHSLQLWR